MNNMVKGILVKKVEGLIDRYRNTLPEKALEQDGLLYIALEKLHATQNDSDFLRTEAAIASTIVNSVASYAPKA